MESRNRQLAEALFAPLRVTFSSPRPDGGIVLALLDASDATAYSRVISTAQQDAEAFAQSLENIRLELALRAGNIPADMRKALKEQDSVISYELS